ncbi:MAG: dynamin family protein [Akkermansia sp.]
MSDTSIEQLIQDSDRYLAKLRLVEHCSPAFSACTARSMRSIKRSIRRFDSQLLLMATIGSVKSGKSTLTNCLARRELCATTLGIETTTMPLIIIASQDGTERMELYSSKATGQLSEEELFEQVIDQIRGIPADDFSEKVAVDRLPLNQESLTSWATGETRASCAAIFLVEPDASILQANCGIIDMPGMDGLKSNWQEEKLHTWMNRHADYFLLVQSSFAALTPDTSTYLKRAMDLSPRPIRVVQNRIKAQYWLNQDKQDAAQNAQQQHTQKQLRQIVQQLVPSSWVNAGLAWWQIHEPDANQDLDSHLKHLEQAILDDISNPESTLRSNGLDVLHKCLEQCDADLQASQLAAETHITEMNKKENDVRLLMDTSQLRQMLECGNMLEGRHRCHMLAKQAKERLHHQLDLILDLKIDTYFPTDWEREKMAGEKLNPVILKVNKDLTEMLKNQEVGILSPEKVCELIDAEIIKIKACADILKRRSASDIEKDTIKSILDAWEPPSLQEEQVLISPLKETSFLGAITKNYHYRETASELRDQGRFIISSILERWEKHALEQLDKFITKRMGILAERLNAELEQYQESAQTGRTRELAQADIKAAAKLREDLAPVLLIARKLKAMK